MPVKMSGVSSFCRHTSTLLGGEKRVVSTAVRQENRRRGGHPYLFSTLHNAVVKCSELLTQTVPEKCWNDWLDQMSNLMSKERETSKQGLLHRLSWG